MSTPNFWTMKDFDLYAMHDGAFLETAEDDGEYSGEPFFNQWAYDRWSESLGLDALNEGLRFHSVRLMGGYYAHTQLYVDAKHDPRGMDNYETNYYFDMCRSKAIRAFEAEVRRIRRWMDKHCPAAGMQKLVCVGIFSNGEAVYEIAA